MKTAVKKDIDDGIVSVEKAKSLYGYQPGIDKLSSPPDYE